MSSRSYPALLSFVEEPLATLARSLLDWGESTALDEASVIVDELESAAAANHHPLRHARALLLRALLFRSRGGTDAALKLLGDVVERTRPAGLIRTFVDLGAPMRELLVGLAEHRAERDLYLGRVIAAFPSIPVDASLVSDEHKEPDAGHTQRELVEPLTWREHEILELLAERLSNKEIAARLVISPLTVKRHSMNIYQKLQATGRRDAVARAASLGLLRSG